MESDSTTSSTRSGRSASVRVRKLRKQSSMLNEQDKSLTSFPSLSPENSPAATKNFQKSNGSMEVSRTPAAKRRAHKSSISALTSNTPSFRNDRGALFQDSPSALSQDMPGALHLSSDQHIGRLIERRGAIDLVRQLAEDLAAREAEITTYRWRAEARERELKKMLREVEVSNLDIERRLRALDVKVDDTNNAGGSEDKRRNFNQKKSFSGITDGIGGLMQEALGDDLGAAENDSGFPDSIDSIVEAEVPRVRKDDDAVSTSSVISENKTLVKGWKDYIWSGSTTKTSRASSILEDSHNDHSHIKGKLNSAGQRRRGLNEDLFSPPSDEAAAADKVMSSVSKNNRATSTSWTVKLFAGKPSGKDGESGAHNTKDRKGSNTSDTIRGLRKPSQASNVAESSAKAALLKVNKKHPSTGTLRKPSQPLSYGPTGTIRNASQSAAALASSSPDSKSDVNLGPVEMDAILPHETRPPTLTPYNQNINDTNDFLTDRFGFIYDQRRRKKEAETLARLAATQGKSSKELMSTSKDSTEVDSISDSLIQRAATPASQEEISEDRPSKRWQDYLKIATFPTELLSHTPSSGNIMTLSNADMKRSLERSPTFEDGHNRPLPTPLPPLSASSVNSSNAEITSPSTTVATPDPSLLNTTATGDFEPVKLLLTQLTDLHDSLQRDKTVKWNEFMRKVRAERRKEDEAASESRAKSSAGPEAYMTNGEMIGIAEVGNKGKVGRAKYREFKVLVLGGIPVALRAKIWAECSGATAMRVPGYYEDIVSVGDDDPSIIAQIQMDINRTLTDNVFFRKGPGVAKLNEVLLAYSRRNPEVGYCQGMNLITASLLLIMPTAEDAFWVLASMIENILPRHYYDNSLLASRADQQVLRQYVTDLLPKLSSHLENLDIELEALTFQWFLSLFTDCLSAEALYRVWDVLLCCKDEEGNGGSTFLFQVALALLKLNETQLLACETPGEIYAYLGGEITNHAISIDGLIKASEGLKTHIRRSEVEERRARWVEVEQETIRERERIRNETPVNGKDKDKKRGSTDFGMTDELLEVIEPMPVQG